MTGNFLAMWRRLVPHPRERRISFESTYSLQLRPGNLAFSQAVAGRQARQSYKPARPSPTGVCRTGAHTAATGLPQPSALGRHGGARLQSFLYVGSHHDQTSSRPLLHRRPRSLLVHGLRFGHGFRNGLGWRLGQRIGNSVSAFVEHRAWLVLQLRHAVRHGRVGWLHVEHDRPGYCRNQQRLGHVWHHRQLGLGWRHHALIREATPAPPRALSGRLQASGRRARLALLVLGAPLPRPGASARVHRPRTAGTAQSDTPGMGAAWCTGGTQNPPRSRYSASPGPGRRAAGAAPSPRTMLNRKALQ